jgi:oxaloacetate decarboxylase beta subunit
MEYSPKPISQTTLVAFPIVLTLAVGLLVPEATPLISMLMLGNLLKVSGVVPRLSKAAENEIINIATLFLGLAVGATMSAGAFLNWATVQIMLLGLLAFVLDTVAGLLFGKLMCFVSGGKINPLIGASGISAFPMAGRLAAKMASEEDPDNFILMHAMGANTAGQLGSVMAGGILLAIVSKLV